MNQFDVLNLIPDLFIDFTLLRMRLITRSLSGASPSSSSRTSSLVLVLDLQLLLCFVTSPPVCTACHSTLKELEASVCCIPYCSTLSTQLTPMLLLMSFSSIGGLALDLSALLLWITWLWLLKVSISKLMEGSTLGCIFRVLPDRSRCALFLKV